MKMIIKYFLLVALLAGNVFGQKLFLKKSFFTGYSISTDSINYEKLNDDTLQNFIKDNTEALEFFNSYKTNRTFSLIFGYSGGFLVGWPLGGYLGSGGDWKDGYTTMLIVGGSLVILSIVFESIASNNLEKAVDTYNHHLIENNFKINIGFYPNKKEISLLVMYDL
jgi:hypothetical protein